MAVSFQPFKNRIIIVRNAKLEVGKEASYSIKSSEPISVRRLLKDGRLTLANNRLYYSPLNILLRLLSLIYLL
jgi:hypothetical protein